MKFKSTQIAVYAIALVTIVLVSYILFIADTETFRFEKIIFPSNKPPSTTLNHINVVPKKDTITWTPPIVPDDIAKAEQTDNRLAEYIRNQWLLPPFEGPRNLDNPSKLHYSQYGQSKYIDDLLKQKTNGFYIECGAASGEGLSNSLFFEKSRNWTGILIEANPLMFRNILKVRRHAYMLNACLSPTKYPAKLDFRTAGVIGGLTNFMDKGHKRRVISEEGYDVPIKLQCFPLLAVLRAMNVTHVDYFSLDIEGAELEILNSFPFDEIKVDVLTVEYGISGGWWPWGASWRKLKNIKDLMEGHYGYKQPSYWKFGEIMLLKGV